jgi:hypothetical protein
MAEATMPPDPLAALTEVAKALEPGQLQLLLEMALAIGQTTPQRVAADSDIVVPDFSTNFSNRLKIHHATTEESFKKKPFEYAFKAASRAAGHQARIVTSATHPGADVIVDGTGFSLKTEAPKGIRPRYITISKLMEARWIRECRTGQDFAEGVRSHVTPHLLRYERVLMLRAFPQPEDGNIRYDLMEIPVDLLRQVDRVAPAAFTPRTTNGSTSADVVLNGRNVFRLRLDGSVEKVTIANLDVEACRFHASWTVPVLVAGDESDDSEEPDDSG